MKNFTRRVRLILIGVLLVFPFVNTNAQSWLWANTSADSAISVLDPIDLTTDNAGNIIETGELVGHVKFGAVDLISPPGATDAFIVKYDNNGNALWGIAPGINLQAEGNSVVADNYGNVYLTGFYMDTMWIGSFIFPSISRNRTLFVAKFSSSGVFKWGAYSKIPAIGSNISSNSIAVDRVGNSYITGFFIDSATIGSIKIFARNYNFFLAKFDTNGKAIWVKTGRSQSFLNAFIAGATVVTDTAGSVYVTGEFTDSITIGANTLTSKGYRDVFLAKFDSSGNVTWLTSPTVSTPGGSVSQFGGRPGRFLSTDKAGNLYLMGLLLRDTVHFGTYTLINNSTGIFVAKYSSAGNVLWAKENIPFNNSHASVYQPYSISCNKQTNFFLCGTFADSIAFNTVKVKSDSTEPSFILEFDSSGNAICGSEVNNYNDDWNSVTADPMSNGVFFTGDISLEDGCYFGSYFLTPTSNGANEYGFLAKWACSTTEGINEINNKNEGINVYPNPNNGVFTIAFSHPELVSGSQTIEVFNVLGEKLMTEILRSAQDDKVMDLRGQPNGIYFYRVLTETGALVGSGKLIIQK